MAVKKDYKLSFQGERDFNVEWEGKDYIVRILAEGIMSSVRTISDKDHNPCNDLSKEDREMIAELAHCQVEDEMEEVEVEAA